MKKYYALMLLCLFIMIAPASCYASVKVAQAPGPATISGSDLYYVKIGASRGLYKYNIKTKKNQLIKTGNFSQISLKGDYIYYVYADSYIDADSNTYYAIYRMKKDGTKEKRLAYGDSPVIIGKWIYYIEHKLYSGPTTDSIGYISKMKLDGTSKKKIKKVDATALYKYGNKILYSKTVTNDGGRSNVDAYLYTMKGKKSSYKNKIRRYINCSREQYTYNGYTSANTHYLRVGNYVYYGKRANTDNNVARVYNVYKKNPKNGKEKIIYNSGTFSISHLFALSNYIYLEMYSTTGNMLKSVLVDINGKVVTEL